MKTSLFLFFNYLIFMKIVEAQLGPNRLGTLKTPGAIEGSKATLSTPPSNRPSSYEQMAPKCYPETAKAYFLPAPPAAPIVTILDTNSMDIASNFRSSFNQISPSLPVSPTFSNFRSSFEEISSNPPVSPTFSNFRSSFEEISSNPPVSPTFSNFRSSFEEISSSPPVSPTFSNFRSSFEEISSSPPVSPNFFLNQAGLIPPPIQVLPDLIDEVPLLIQDRFSRLAESEDVGKVCETCALVAKLPIYNFDQELLNGFLAGLGF